VWSAPSGVGRPMRAAVRPGRRGRCRSPRAPPRAPAARPGGLRGARLRARSRRPCASPCRPACRGASRRTRAVSRRPSLARPCERRPRRLRARPARGAGRRRTTGRGPPAPRAMRARRRPLPASPRGPPRRLASASRARTSPVPAAGPPLEPRSAPARPRRRARRAAVARPHRRMTALRATGSYRARGNAHPHSPASSRLMRRADRRARTRRLAANSGAIASSGASRTRPAAVTSTGRCSWGWAGKSFGPACTSRTVARST